MDLKTINKKKAKELLGKGVIILVFAGFMSYLFYSSPEKEDKKVTGLNTELPDGKATPMEGKMKAYETAEGTQEREMKTLDDYVSDLRARKPGEDPENKTPADKYDLELKDIAKENNGLDVLKSALQTSANNDNYDELASEYTALESENERLRSELGKLKREEERLAVMEKGYAMAARYTEKSDAAVPVEVKPAEESVAEVSRKENNIVTTLSEELLLDAPYNYGFNTAVGSGYESGTNTIRAAVSEDQTVMAGQRVKLRLLEPLCAGSVTIPRNHLIAGITQLSGDRMNIRIESIEYAGNIIPVSMKVYDTDGMAGIYCPGSAELDAVKEGAANIGAGLGTSVSFARSAGQQIAMDVTRGVMTGGSQYLSKKLRTVKVTLKSNYEVLLLPQKR